MIGAGFIQQMINTMRDNSALLASKRRKNRTADDSRAGKTRLKFPKGDPARINRSKIKYTQQSKVQWILIYLFLGLFFGAILTWVFI